MNHRIHLACCGLVLLAGCGGGGGGDRNEAPQIMGLMDVSVNANETSAPVSFTVSDDGGVGELLVSASSDDQSLLPDGGIAVGGSGGSRTLTFTPVPARLGAASVTVTVLDGGGLRATRSLQVNVVAQDVSFSGFFRDTFNQSEDSAPQDLNSRQFDQDAGQGDFDDLVGGP